MRGWTSNAHPLALASQQLALELSRREDVRLYHQELGRPDGWQYIDSIFDKPSREKLKSIPPPDAEKPIDIVLRFSRPFDLATVPGAERTFVYVAAEMGTVPAHAMAKHVHLRQAAGRSEAMILTPSQWSRRGLIASGVPEEHIVVIPFGVNTTIFRPLPQEQREQLRGKTRAGSDFVFLHVSDLSWSKGLDLLLSAFATVAERHPEARLVLKGVDVPCNSSRRLEEAKAALSDEQRDAVVPRMRYLGELARFEKLAMLYQMADAYVSPYRTTAFHRPALEAAACGLPVICTAGGPTDEFLADGFALPVRSEARSMIVDDIPDATVLLPDVEHLVEQMCAAIERRELRDKARQSGPEAVGRGFTWAAVTDRLMQACLASLQ